MASSHIALYPINFQDAIKSKPLRENNAILENAVNALQDEVNALSTAASGSEVVIARDAASTLAYGLRERFALFGNGILSGTLLDAFNAADWDAVAPATAPALDTAYSVDGIASMQGGKAASASGCAMRYAKEFTGTEDLTDARVKAHVYLASNDVNKIDTSTGVILDVTSDTTFVTNYKSYYATTALSAGWNEVVWDLSATPDASGGSVTMSAVKTLRIGFNTNAASDSITRGNVKFDDLRAYRTEGRVYPASGLSVAVTRGYALIDGKSVSWSNVTSSPFSAPATGTSRIDTIAIGHDGALAFFVGIASSVPLAREIPKGHVPLANVYVRDSASSVVASDDGVNAYIQDVRRFFSDYRAGAYTYTVDSDATGASGYGYHFKDVNSANAYGSNPTLLITREASPSGVALQVGDDMQVTQSGWLYGNAFRYIDRALFTGSLATTFSSGIALPSGVPATAKYVHATFLLDTVCPSYNGEWVTMQLYISDTAGTTEKKVFEYTNTSTGTAVRKAFVVTLPVPVSGGKMWVRYASYNGGGTVEVEQAAAIAYATL